MTGYRLLSKWRLRLQIPILALCKKMRTLDEQKELVAKGASKTLKSKHLEGKAFDIMAYVNSRASWELNLYDNLADAIKQSGNTAWRPNLLGSLDGHALKRRILWIFALWEGTMEEAMNAYDDLRRSQTQTAVYRWASFRINRLNRIKSQFLLVNPISVVLGSNQI